MFFFKQKHAELQINKTLMIKFAASRPTFVWRGVLWQPNNLTTVNGFLCLNTMLLKSDWRVEIHDLFDWPTSTHAKKTKHRNPQLWQIILVLFWLGLKIIFIINSSEYHFFYKTSENSKENGNHNILEPRMASSHMLFSPSKIFKPINIPFTLM